MNIIPIGRPISNTQVYILDQYLQPLPVGITGEIYLGGDGVARGYLNKPTLTAEKFIPNPFGEGKLYKTGDLGRYLPDGNIEFIDRIDHQVKIRGFRIELGEIETLLNQNSKVEESLVTVFENETQNKQLIAYIIPNQKQVPNPTELKKYLQEKLPEYMIPSAYIPLEAFPLTPNGKIDKKALPKPEREHSLNTEIILPRTETEKKLAKIWQEVLWLNEEISINDNFFDLGGHSLLSVKLVSEIEKEFQQELPLTALFQMGTIADLAEILDQDKDTEETVITTTIKTENTINLDPQIYRTLFAYTSGWKGNRFNPNSLVFGHNLQGTKPPLFWVLQGYRELSQLAKYLGEEQPIYGMRSGHLIMEYTEENLQGLANYYAHEISQIQPNEPYFLGGNCQSATIVTEIAKQLQKQGKKVALLCLLDDPINTYYLGKTALIFSRDNHLINPYWKYHNPELKWKKVYPLGYSLKMISGGYGESFGEPVIQELTQTINEFLTETIAEIEEEKIILSREKYQAEIIVSESLNLPPNQSLTIVVKVKNISPVKWEKTETSNIRLGNHWLNKEEKYLRWLDGISDLDQAILPNEEREIFLTINTPQQEGQYLLEIDLVEEGITWFKNKGSKAAQIIIDINQQHKYINPQQVSSLLEKPTIKEEIKEEMFFEKGDYIQAVKYYQNFLKNNEEQLKNEPEKLTEIYYKLAHSYYQISELTLALSYCNKYVELDQKNPQIYYLIAEIQYDLNYIDQAIQNYQKTLAFNYHASKIYVKLGRLLEHKGLYLEAKEIYRKAINLSYDNPILYDQLAKLEIKDGYLEKAIKLYEQLLEIAPDYQLNWYIGLGHVYQQQKDLTSAFNVLEKALELAPNNLAIMRNLATIKWEEKDIESTMFYCEKILAIAPNNAFANHSLSVIYLQKNELDKVSIYIKKALAKQPNNPDFNWTFANFQRQKSNLEEALKYYQKTLDCRFSNPVAVLIQMAEIFKEKGAIQKAINTYQKAIEIQPKNLHLNRSLATLNWQQNNIQSAIFYCQKVLEIDDSDAIANHILSVIALKRNELDQGLIHLNKALQKEPNNPYYNFTLGHFKRQKNNLEEALQYYQKALNFGFPNKIIIFNHLAEIFKQKGDIQKAINHYQKALTLQPNNQKLITIIQELTQQNNKY